MSGVIYCSTKVHSHKSLYAAVLEIAHSETFAAIGLQDSVELLGTRSVFEQCYAGDGTNN